MEYFKDAKTTQEVYQTEVEIPLEILDKMPKFTVDLFKEMALGKFDFSSYTKNMDARMLDSTKERHLKDLYNLAGMYAFISWKWINPFVEWLDGRKVLEVMAGRGWWTYALRQKGVDAIATDDFSWERRNWIEPLTDVEKMDAVEAIERYAKQVDVVLMGWPYMDDTAYRVLRKLHEVNPDIPLVYIGEMGGCTADSTFFEHYGVIHHDKKFNEVSEEYESWEHIKDSIYLGKYREENDSPDWFLKMYLEKQKE